MINVNTTLSVIIPDLTCVLLEAGTYPK